MANDTTNKNQVSEQDDVLLKKLLPAASQPVQEPVEPAEVDPYLLGDSGLSFIDGDTLKDPKTDSRLRLAGIDMEELTKVNRHGLDVGEAGGGEAKDSVAYLANKYGYTNVQKVDYDKTNKRDVVELLDDNGKRFSTFLAATGIAKPTYIGKSNQVTDQEDYAQYLLGMANRASKKKGDPLTDFEQAREDINLAALESTGGVPMQKLEAFNEEEYALMPELFSGVTLRNKEITMEGRAKHPFSAAASAGVSSAMNGFRQLGAKLSEMAGFEDMQTSLEAKAGYSTTKMGRGPKVLLDHRDVDWTSFDDVTEYLGGNLAMSLPYMGVIAGATLLAPVTGGASAIVPASMYTGMVLDEMGGKTEDKNFGYAVAGGVLASALDKIGFQGAVGLFAGKNMLTNQAKKTAIKAIKETTDEGVKARVKLVASQILGKPVTELTDETIGVALGGLAKREMAAMTADAAEFAAMNLTKMNVARNLVGKATKGAGIEGVTEALQELTQYTAAVAGSEANTWDWDEIEQRMIGAAVAGGTLGAGLSVPGSIYETGQWVDAKVRKSPNDLRFVNEVNASQAEIREKYNGVIPDVEEILEETQAEINAKGATAAASGQARTSTGNLDGRVEEHKETQKERTTGETIKDIFSDPIKALREGISTAVNTSVRARSDTAKLLYDMYGGIGKKFFGGVSYYNYKNQVYVALNNKVGNIDAVVDSFKLPRTQSFRSKKSFVDATMRNFYTKYIYPKTMVGPDGKTLDNAKRYTGEDVDSMIDWDSIQDPEFKPYINQIRKTIRDLYTVDEAMYEAMQAQRKASGITSDLGNLQDHIFRSKSLNKQAIAKNKGDFISQLVESYGMDRSDAASLTESILDNQEINSIDDAFDITRGGLAPRGHKRRTLNLSDNQAFKKYMDESLFSNTDSLIKSTSRYVAHTKYIGPNSSVLSAMIDKIETELRGNAEPGSEKARQARQEANAIASSMADLVNADSGNYKRIQSPFIRNAQKFVTVFGVLSMLPLAAVSSIVEFGLTFRNVSHQNLHNNVGSFGILVAKELYDYVANIGKIAKVTDRSFEVDKEIASRTARMQPTLPDGSPNPQYDPRYRDIGDTGALLDRAGFGVNNVGSATLTGVTEKSELTQTIMESFFKIIGLENVTTLTRSMRASFYNDFLIENLDMIARNEGKPDTIEVAQARKVLLDIGVPVDKMLLLSKQLADPIGSQDPAVLAEYERQFNNGLTNFISQSVPMPNAMNRPLFYSNQHLALFTQFQGYVSTFTATILPKMWEDMRLSTPGLKYSTFSAMMTMLMLAYASQYLKDLIKFGEESPYLDDKEKWLRAVYSSGLLGTPERILSSNMVLPLYEDRTRSMAESLWVNIGGEAPASGMIDNLFMIGQGAWEGENDKLIKGLVKLTPLGPIHTRVREALSTSEF